MARGRGLAGEDADGADGNAEEGHGVLCGGNGVGGCVLGSGEDCEMVSTTSEERLKGYVAL